MSLTLREEAEAIEAFGDALSQLCMTFCAGFRSATVDRVCAVPHQDQLEAVAKAMQALGRTIQAECDAAEEDDDRRRDNPLEPDFRRIA